MELWTKRLQEITPGMKLNKAYFLSVYCDEITWPGSAEAVIKALENAGCSNARKYYTQVVEEYQRKRDEELKSVAKLVQTKWDKEWEKLVKEREVKWKTEKWMDGMF